LGVKNQPEKALGHNAQEKIWIPRAKAPHPGEKKQTENSRKRIVRIYEKPITLSLIIF
jgi:hypothetical protein